ncbi:MAG: hypothetical protein ABSD41_04690, partial [Candidatus Bathyarchaeia archaeon]
DGPEPHGSRPAFTGPARPCCIVRVLRSVQATTYPTSRLSALSGPKPTYRYSRSVHRLMTINTRWLGMHN